MGMTFNSVSSVRRQAGAEFLLLDSGAQLHACPIPYPGQKIPSLDPGIHTASGARLQHDGGRLVTYKLPEGRTIRVLFHACAVQIFFFVSAVSLSRGTGVIFVQILEHCSFLTIPRSNVASHSCTRKSLFFVKGTMVAPLTTAGVSDKVAQEIQVPVGPQMLEDVEEPMLARPATLSDPGTPDQSIPEDTIHHIENSRKSMQLYLNFS